MTFGFLANKIEIRENNEDGKLLYSSKKSVISMIILLFLRPWYNRVNYTLKGVNKSDFSIKDVGRHKHVLIEENIEIGYLKGRKLFDTRYHFEISFGNLHYFYEGDVIVPITKVYKNNFQVGVFKLYNQRFPKFNWEAEVNPDMDQRVVVTALLYNYIIWDRA